jgi:hypothetical protein
MLQLFPDFAQVLAMIELRKTKAPLETLGFLVPSAALEWPSKSSETILNDHRMAGRIDGWQTNWLLPLA